LIKQTNKQKKKQKQN